MELVIIKVLYREENRRVKVDEKWASNYKNRYESYECLIVPMNEGRGGKKEEIAYGMIRWKIKKGEGTGKARKIDKKKNISYISLRALGLKPKASEVRSLFDGREGNGGLRVSSLLFKVGQIDIRTDARSVIKKRGTGPV